MSISYIPINLNIEDYKSWDINDEIISKFEIIENDLDQLKKLIIN